MSRFLCEKFQGKEGYHFGERPQDRAYIKLNTNESPFPPAPSVLAAATGKRLLEQNLYADPANSELVEAVAEYYHVEPDMVLADCGSDVLLAYCLLAYGSDLPGFCFPDITYNFYKTFSRAYGIPVKEIPLAEDFSIRAEDYCGCGRNVLIANPNAPTGLVLSLEQVERIVRTNPDHVVIIDEAYVDFENQSCVPLLNRYHNLIVIQTMSKSRCLAGARVGYAIASKEIIGDLGMLRAAFNPDSISSLSQAAGCAAIHAEEYMRSCVAKIIRSRGLFTQGLRERGFGVLESHTNFVLAKPSLLSAERYYEAMKQNGVLIRYFDQPRIRDYVRITIGTEEQMKEVLFRTDQVLREAEAFEAEPYSGAACAAGPV